MYTDNCTCTWKVGCFLYIYKVIAFVFLITFHKRDNIWCVNFISSKSPIKSLKEITNKIGPNYLVQAATNLAIIDGYSLKICQNPLIKENQTMVTRMEFMGICK